MRWTTNARALGSPSALAFAEVKDRIIEALSDDWETTKDVREGLEDPKPSIDQTGKALAALAEAGKVERDPPITEGAKQGARYKWRRVNFTSDDPSLRSEVRLEVSAYRDGDDDRLEI